MDSAFLVSFLLCTATSWAGAWRPPSDLVEGSRLKQAVYEGDDGRDEQLALTSGPYFSAAAIVSPRCPRVRGVVASLICDLSAQPLSNFFFSQAFLNNIILLLGVNLQIC